MPEIRIDPLTGQRYYKHFQNTPACMDAKNLPDYEWSYWQLHH